MSAIRFPPAWVINLSERPDRREAFQRRAALAGLEYREHTVDRCTEKRDGWGASAEACGNATAHHDLLSSGLGPLMVFEDDAVLPVELAAYLDLALHAMPREWELLLLGAGAIVSDKTRALVPGLEPVQSFLLTHAYVVSARGREAMATAAADANWHWDYLASRRMCGRGQVYGFVPTIVTQDRRLGSDIP